MHPKTSSFARMIDISKKIPLRNKGKLEYLPIENVEHIEAARNYSIIHALNGTNWVSSKTLQAFDDLLNPSSQFLRLHRSYLVNLSLIVDCFYENDSFVVLLRNQKKIRVARRHIKRVRSTVMNVNCT
ncbi:LytTr DNA-binding domain-containing protein [Dyadobacter koreensis]|uniref:LytTr DNA-binding domain-containing protein n=1 Tax=Dyadobacter koreensis TaxID=408657 RepID=A0A1H6TQF4_9BACT|nr:LytTR family DNA-binding domain-containing protein [Dyadobacter koreensis]SEI78435.1 LytTr DNA-binding domain-containing protein [Dyadobacter koreensis]